MNEQAREALVAAGLRGDRQIKRNRTDREGGHCALGIIGRDLLHNPWFTNYEVAGIDVNAKDMTCPVDGCGHVPYSGEVGIITHLNNEHGWDFLTIARKLGA